MQRPKDPEGLMISAAILILAIAMSATLVVATLSAAALI